MLGALTITESLMSSLETFRVGLWIQTLVNKIERLNNLTLVDVILINDKGVC